MKHAIPGYHFKTALGTGGMASVFLATQTSLDRAVAIKILNAKFCDELRQSSLAKQHFLQECKIIAQLNHPNIVQVIDQGITEQGMPYFVMPYVKCIALHSVLKRDDVSLTRKLDILIQVCSALSYAHRNQIIHRDIKPANVLVDYDGHARLVDFGIAGYFTPQETGSTESQMPHPPEASAKHAMVAGTSAYMAPEQRDSANKTSHHSDIYSLGALMHETLLGCPPNIASADKIKAPENDHSKIIPHLRPTIEHCLETLPQNRPGSVEEVRQALLLVAQGRHLRNNHWKLDSKRDKLPPNYQLLDVIKENPFGATYLVNDANKQRLLVVKKQNLDQLGNAPSCAMKLSHIRHPSLTKIYGTGKNQRVFITVNEYVPAGSLQERLSNTFSMTQWATLALQLCQALACAHSYGIVHGDLRPSNVLFAENNHIKLTDFGFPTHNYGLETHWYHPVGEEYSHLVDIYAAGAILFQVLTGFPPQPDWWGLKNHWKLRHYPKPVRKILLKMIASNPRNRIPSAELAALKFSELQESQETQISLEENQVLE
ncbi:Serine/threonine-protein kinase PknB [Thalassocella blandensis]|nr:Serine/threonine-protein kinase PknB [Thalassocella blandensis]